MTITTDANPALRQAEIAAAGRLTVAEMRAMIEASHRELDEAENMVDRVEAAAVDRGIADDLRSHVERARVELGLFEELADAFEQGRLDKPTRRAFAHLLRLPTTH